MKRTLLALMAAAVMGTLSAQEANDIRIGVVVPLTGSSKDMGNASRHGTALAAAEINARGGINGRKIVLVQYDDKGNPFYAQKVAREAIANGKLHAMIGTVNESVATATMPMWQAAKIPTFITGATGNEILADHMKAPVSYIFRIMAPKMLQVQTIVRDMRAKGVKSAYIFADTTDFGRSGRRALIQEMTRAGIKVSGNGRFSPNTRDFEEAAIEARTTAPDAVVIWGAGFDQAALNVAMNRIGWRPAVYGSHKMAQVDYINALGFNATGSRIPMTYTTDSARPVAQQFLLNYQRFTNQYLLTSPLAAASGFDAMYLYALAVQQAGTTDADAVVNALENLQRPYEGVMKTYVRPFSRANHEAFTNSNDLYMGVVKQGDVVRYIETPAAPRTASRTAAAPTPR